MEAIQVAISDAAYADALRELLVRNGSPEVLCVDRPNPNWDGVMVLDSEHLDLLPRPIPNPERVVLVARNESDELARAWEAGVTSVITDKDPLNTAVLAIMAARLRTGKGPHSGPQDAALEKRARVAGETSPTGRR